MYDLTFISSASDILCSLRHLSIGPTPVRVSRLHGSVGTTSCMAVRSVHGRAIRPSRMNEEPPYPPASNPLKAETLLKTHHAGVAMNARTTEGNADSSHVVKL